MREYKFRAWDKKNNEWVHFGLNDIENGYLRVDYPKYMHVSIDGAELLKEKGRSDEARDGV